MQIEIAYCGVCHSDLHQVRDGTRVLLVAPQHPHAMPDVMTLLLKRRAIAGSIIGGIAARQQMRDFCAAQGIVAEIEMIPIQRIDAAYERMLKSDGPK